ncbi:MAG: hypothetical protein RDV48_11430 [Candidatus Eremiobacteraeota bacterium]|nr:hypothetical protein [Candidatus Eremiobacteraeota bacterium]
MDRKALEISAEKLREINDFLCDPRNALINEFLEVVKKYGTIEEIKRKGAENGTVESLVKRLEHKEPSYLKDLEWLREQRDKGAFIPLEDYRKKVLGGRYESVKCDDAFAVTLEISSLQYFPWLIDEARQAIAKQEIMPGRYIRVRKMKEQEDDGDLLAVAAAMQIIGASWVETLDTKGTDGSNIHLGGPDTITGYFGGVGQPNQHALKWLDEYLHYYTTYGVKQVLNINPGTVLLGYLLHKLGLDNEFKISVFMGNDNPYSVFWTLLTAKLFSTDRNTTPLIGFNFSNSVNNRTIELCAQVRHAFSFDDMVRFEHHILETCRSIVVQPYDRREDLLDMADKVKNISAKHEGGEVAVESGRDHPSDILDYFMPKAQVLEQGLMDSLLRNYMDKHDAVNCTARRLTEKGFAFIGAKSLHHRALVRG